METKMTYLDHAATTAVKREVLEEMLPYFSLNYGNPSSLYRASRKSRNAIEIAREQVAKFIHAKKSEIYFCSGGTEADNWAIIGAAHQNKHQGMHIITSAIEHSAVLSSCRQLEKEGYLVSYLPVDSQGMINLDTLKESIRPDTILISIMMANNEVGTIQPITEIALIAKEKGILFHTDAISAAGGLSIDVSVLNVDLLSLSAHKFYGPKGIGALYIKKGTAIEALHTGGEQEKGRRAGTENVPSIIGMGKAAELMADNLQSQKKQLVQLRDNAIKRILQRFPEASLNGPIKDRLPGNVNILFPGCSSESMITKLDERGFSVSSGSACAEGSPNPSHVLKAMGLSHSDAQCSLRFTFGEENTLQDVEDLLTALDEIIPNKISLQT
ncbi:MAG: cysteine desulfurase family protein [Clostridiaceae bacterium]